MIEFVASSSCTVPAQNFYSPATITFSFNLRHIRAVLRKKRSEFNPVEWEAPGIPQKVSTQIVELLNGDGYHEGATMEKTNRWKKRQFRITYSHFNTTGDCMLDVVVKVTAIRKGLWRRGGQRTSVSVYPIRYASLLTGEEPIGSEVAVAAFDEFEGTFREACDAEGISGGN